VGSETYSLLVDSLNINVADILSKVAVSQSARGNSDSKSKCHNPFSIENLLSNGTRNIHSLSKEMLNGVHEKSNLGLFRGSSSPYSSDHDDDDSTNSSVAESYMSSPRASSELDVTDEPEFNEMGPIDVTMPNRKRLQTSQKENTKTRSADTNTGLNSSRLSSTSPTNSLSSI